RFALVRYLGVYYHSIDCLAWLSILTDADRAIAKMGTVDLPHSLNWRIQRPTRSVRELSNNLQVYLAHFWRIAMAEKIKILAVATAGTLGMAVLYVFDEATSTAVRMHHLLPV